MRPATLLVSLAVLVGVSSAGAVSIPVGTLPAGATVTLEVDVQVAAAVTPADLTAEVCSQGSVSGGTFATVPTDDPEVVGSADPTCSSLPEYGDAPSPYPTLVADNGAVHAMAGGIFLGGHHDADADGQPDATATGDDDDGSNDDDGVSFTSEVVPGTTATVDVVASAPCLLNAWYDFNLDGDWDDPGEQIFVDRPLAAGANAGLAFPVPAGAPMGPSFARFRGSSAGGLSATGLAPDGEVEDYLVATVPVELQSLSVE